MGKTAGMLISSSAAAQSDAAGEGRNAPCQARCGARHQEALTDREHEKACSDAVLSLPEKPHGQQRGRDDQANTVDCPKYLA